MVVSTCWCFTDKKYSWGGNVMFALIYWVRVFIQNITRWRWTKPSERGSCFSTSLIILRHQNCLKIMGTPLGTDTYITYRHLHPGDYIRHRHLHHIWLDVSVCTSWSPQGFNTLHREHIKGEIVCNVLKVRVVLEEIYNRSYTCHTVVSLTRIMVLPRLKSRSPSDLNTGFSSETRLKDLESGPVVFPSSD